MLPVRTGTQLRKRKTMEQNGVQFMGFSPEIKGTINSKTDRNH